MGKPREPMFRQHSGDDALSLRSPPHNFEAEVQLLGAILTNNRAFDRVADFLRAEHFADDTHARIFEACGKLINRGQIASATTLKNYFEQDATLAEIGGVPYLAKMASAAVTIINAGDHGRLILDLYRRRQLIAIGEDLVNEAYAHDLEKGADQIGAEHAEKIDAVTADVVSGGLVPLREGLDKAIENVDRAKKHEGGLVGVTTGLIDLDKKLGGLHKTDLIVVGARPGMGKTAFAMTVAEAAAKAYQTKANDNGAIEVVAGARVGFFSLEMSLEQLSGRVLAQQTGISSDRQRRGAVDMFEIRELLSASEDLAKLPILVDDTPGLNLAQIKQRARRAHRVSPLGLIIIDYLGLIEEDGRSENRVQAISKITRGLKGLAKELGVPVLLLCQLSRKVEDRDDKRPNLADLRESGSIEQDADVVMFLYRHEYYLDREKPRRRLNESDERFNDRYALWGDEMAKCKGVAEIDVAKQRHGPIGTVDVHYDAERTRFGNLQREAA